MSDRNKIEEHIEKYADKCRKVADYLTDHPEISGQEEQSCKFLVEFLRDHGYEVTTPYAGMPHSFLAVCKGKDKNKKKVAFLSEYDALQEVGHACGHSLSAASSILAALAINEIMKETPIRFDVIGTPGEETVGGKVTMTENGGFDGYEYAAMVHMNNENQTSFSVLASNDRYITFRGKASHASASPEVGFNALNAARLYMDAMDMWRQHLPSDCQLHGIVDSGGEAPNIVPAKVSVDYYFRAASMENLAVVNEKAELSARGAAIATGTTYQIEQRYPDYGEIFCNEYRHVYLKSIFKEIGRNCVIPEKPAGSSDAGSVDIKLPVFHPMIDITGGQRNIVLHDTAFEALLHTEEAYDGMKDAARLLCRIAYDMEMNEGLADNIQKDHRRYRQK